MDDLAEHMRKFDKMLLRMFAVALVGAVVLLVGVLLDVRGDSRFIHDCEVVGGRAELDGGSAFETDYICVAPR